MELNGRADVHMHTNVSDGTASVQVVLDQIAHAGKLDVIAITDHDRLEASLWAYQHKANYPFDIIPGVEVTSTDGHVLGLWVTEPIRKGMTLAETVSAIHAQGGLAILAHPFEATIAPHTLARYFSQPEGLMSIGIDAVEVFNAGAITRGCNWVARRVFNRVNIPQVGNSDAHTPDCIGTGYTCFNGKTAADLRESIAHGWTRAEGKRWPVITYLKLMHTAIQWNRSIYLETNTPSTHPTLT
ncbi:MAG: CehA/McbA family metallohydrolase [Anaerolinea sp.]|nr:CehA/McbA family metallohydrolase [Anaerolinea sp.]